MTILVTGGTGALGRDVVRQLLAASGDLPGSSTTDDPSSPGHPSGTVHPAGAGQDSGASSPLATGDSTGVRVLSRRERRGGDPAAAGWAVGDLRTGAGLDQALDGADVIVHCASNPFRPKDDLTAARNLFAAAQRAGRDPHLIYVSIVGVDRVSYGYYGVKLDVERLIEQSGLPWTVLRATQFHDLILMVARALAKLPVIPAPADSRFQPVDAAEVAERMAELALGEPSGLVPDLAGPNIYTVAELVKSYLSAVGKRRPLVPVRIPGQAARALRAGANLAPDRAVGKRTWEEFLADHI